MKPLIYVTTVITALLPAACSRDAVADSGKAESPTRPEWGIYQIYWGRRFEGKLAESVDKLASKPNYVMFYRDLGRPYPRGGIDVIRDIGAAPIISLELWRWHERGTKQLPRIVKGDWDESFRQWAESAKADGRRVLLRFGFEFNGDWFSWGGDPKMFVKAWRRAHRIFDDVGAKNVEWVWAANVTSHPNVPDNDMHHYYPGDDYVDWVAVDGYNWGDDHEPWHKWSSFDELFTDVLKSFAARYPDKPVMIAEFGCPEDKNETRKADWIRDAYRSAARWPRIEALVWFNLDKRREGELDFRIDSTPQSLRAFNETFAAKTQTED